MKTVLFKKHSILSRDTLFEISTDIENFKFVMPKYFNSLIIIEDSANEKLVDEKITFLGRTTYARTKHVIVKPNIHEVYILSGPLKGTFFIEHYEELKSGTEVTISISLTLNGLLRFVPFLRNIIIKKMESIMSEFIICAEKFLKTKT